MHMHNGVTCFPCAPHSEQWVDKAASQHEWVEQHGVDVLQYASIDVQGQASHDKEKEMQSRLRENIVI